MFLIRLLIIGDAGVGKTSLLVRFNENNFVSNQKTTIGVDYKAKEITIDDDKVKLQIWDTAGQERFRSMTSAFYSKAQGVIVTFDVTQRDSFDAVSNWIRDVNMYAPSHCVIMVVANKVDLPEELWRVTREEYQTLSDLHALKVIECSAASGLNVNDTFIELGRMILTKNRQKLAEVNIGPTGQSGNELRVDLNPKKKESCCVVS